MRALHFLFSPSGRLQPGPFVIAALAVYAAGVSSQLLTGQDAVARGGLWLFAAVQAVLTWIWFCLHAGRLHDAGRGSGLAAGVALLYALSVVLLVIVATAFFTAEGSTPPGGSATGALGLMLLLSIFSALSGPQDSGAVIVALLAIMAYLPIALAVVLTPWAATRPSAGT
jgi:uncharacterized membrane protein YhaH (DUF805 family)